jgi:hypothetical protein
MFLLFLSLDDLDSIVAFEAIYCQDNSVKIRDERCLKINLDVTIFYELIVKINRVLCSLIVAQTASEKITFSTN